MPFLGISKDRPSAVSNQRVHSRADIAAVASGCTEPPFILVPPSRFFTVLVAFASPTLHVCCAVLPTLGFMMFQQFATLPPHHAVPPFEVFSPSWAPHRAFAR